VQVFSYISQVCDVSLIYHSVVRYIFINFRYYLEICVSPSSFPNVLLVYVQHVLPAWLGKNLPSQILCSSLWIYKDFRRTESMNSILTTVRPDVTRNSIEARFTGCTRFLNEAWTFFCLKSNMKSLPWDKNETSPVTVYNLIKTVSLLGASWNSSLR
jgi:hypothetical protein